MLSGQFCLSILTDASLLRLSKFNIHQTIHGSFVRSCSFRENGNEYIEGGERFVGTLEFNKLVVENKKETNIIMDVKHFVKSFNGVII